MCERAGIEWLDREVMMSKKTSLILCGVCFALLLILFYNEIRYPEAGSEFVRSLFPSGA